MTLEELNALSEFELLVMEDQLMLDREINTNKRVRHTSGRFIIFIWSGLIWLLLFLISGLLIRNFREGIRGLVSALSVFITLGLAVILSQKLWLAIGLTGRYWCRTLLHYWPCVVYFSVGILVLIKT